LGNDAAAAKAETASRIREETGVAAWPLAEPTRTLAQLHELADKTGEHRSQREKKARQGTRGFA
jgi:hypothetical protein